PGALPALIGWTASHGSVAAGGAALFAIVFLWQIPHFMAIAWLYRDDYGKAGFPMLPVVEPDGVRAGRQAVACRALPPAVATGPDLARPGWNGVSGRGDAAWRGAARALDPLLARSQRSLGAGAVLRIDRLPAAGLDRAGRGQALRAQARLQTDTTGNKAAQ